MIIEAIKAYGEEVRTGVFPAAEHSFGMSDEALAVLKTFLKTD